MPKRLQLLVLGFVAPFGCTASPPPADSGLTSSNEASSGVDEGTRDDETGDPSEGSEVPVDRETCVAPDGVSASPQNIDEALALINALPHPVSIACLLESLERPLDIELTESIFSAQPAGGTESPRVFIFSGELILSIVPDGDGSRLLEFGEVVGEAQTIKGELVFPVEDELADFSPFERVMYDEGVTICGFCHRGETEVENFEGIEGIGGVSAFASTAFAPAPHTIIELSALRASAEACDEPTRRCDILRALFDHGEVRHRAFPETFPTIFDN